MRALTLPLCGRASVTLRTAAVAGAALLAFALSACGGKGATSSPPPTSGTADPPFQQAIPGSSVEYGFNQYALTTSRAGTMKAVLTWADGTIDLDLYVTSAACDTYPLLHCTAIASSDATTGTTETISRTVASGEQYKFWVDNFSTTLPSAYNIQVTIQ